MNDSNWLWLVGIVVVGAAVLLLSGAGPEPEVLVLPYVDTGINVLLPYVDAGTNLVINECSSVRLSCAGYDPNGGRVTYHWTAAGGRGSFDNAHLLHPAYTAPAVCRGGENIILTLTVTNERGVSASDKMVVRVCDTICYLPLERCRPITPAPCRVAPLPPYCPPVPVPCCPPPPTPPSCTPLPPYCPMVPVPCVPPPPPCITPCAAKSVDEGGLIQLRGKVWDPDCNLVSFYWTADKGRFDDPTSFNPVYYAPLTDRCGGEDVCITLTAVDVCCARGYDQLILHINNVNHLPVADAGGDLVVNECASIQLTCSAYDPDGDPLSYCWTATCGRGGFDNPCALHPVYIAPSTDRCEDEDIVLTLTVTDACGASASDAMIVHVNNAINSPPIVKADP